MAWLTVTKNKNTEEKSVLILSSNGKENQYKIQYRVMMSRYRGRTICPECKGTRLRKEAHYVKIGDKSINNLVEMSIDNLKKWFDNLELNETEKKSVSDF